MTDRLRIVRPVTKAECPWLHDCDELAAGDTVFRFHGATYGCINHEKGIAVSKVDGENPFFQIPHDGFVEADE